MAFSLFDLGQALNAGAGAVNNYRQQSSLADLGAKLQTGDYKTAARSALAAGDIQTGLSLLKLGQEQESNSAALRMAGLTDGGSSPQATVAAPSVVAAPSGGNTAGPYDFGKSYELYKSAGASEEEARTLAAVTQAESSGNPMAHNTKAPDDSYGLAQINTYGKLGPERMKQFGLSSYDQLYDPATNARVALEIARGPGGLANWSTYKSGAYQQYLPQGGGVKVADASGAVPQSIGGGVQPTDNGAQAKLENLTRALALAKPGSSVASAISKRIDNLKSQATQTPSLIREYEYAKQQGFNGSLQDFRLSTKPQTTINTGGGPSKSVYDTVEKRTEDARAAAQSLPAFQEATRLLNSGNITLGAGADLRVGMQKIGALFGMDATSASNSEAFRATVAPTVLALVRGLGSGNAISNADREFAEKAAGGNITLEPSTIRRLMEIGQRAAQRKVDAHNKMVDSVYPENTDNGGVRSLFKVDVPAYEPPSSTQAQPKTQQQPEGQPQEQLKPAPSDLIDEAQSALKAGHDRGGIIKKMRLLGYDPSGL